NSLALDNSASLGSASVTVHGGVSGASVLTADTLNLDGSGAVGSSGSSVNTKINTLALNDKRSGDGFITETDSLNVQGHTAGNLKLTSKATTISGDLSASGGTVTMDSLALEHAVDLGGGTVAVNGVVNGSSLLAAKTLKLTGAGTVGST